MHERQVGFTNGGPLVVQGLSAPSQLAGAGGLLVLALTLLEPASAFGMAWWQRAGFYAAHVAPAMAVAWWVSGWLFNRPSLQRWPAWAPLALAGAAAGVALAPWSVTLEMALGVVDLDEPGVQPLPRTLQAWWTELADELLQAPPRTALFWLVMNLWVLWRARGPELELATPEVLRPPADAAAPSSLVSSSGAPTDSSTASTTTSPAPSAEAGALLARLPARLGRDVVQLEAQQHYLRVVTTRGEHLLLHGLAPAMAELSQRGMAGMQIHRSVWVAWAHVERLDLRPGSLAAVMRDGRRLPIGRRRAHDVAQAWHQWPGAADMRLAPPSIDPESR